MKRVAILISGGGSNMLALVRDMAGETQFVFISHNKVTMEMASQLVGITMQEPGVSTPIAVKLDEIEEFQRN